MLVHSVYFFLKPELTDEQRVAFRKGLESLKAVRSAAAVYVGTPAPVAERPVLEKGYSFGLTVLFEDMAAHDSYQVDPLHQTFLDTFRSQWSKVIVFDTL